MTPMWQMPRKPQPDRDRLCIKYQQKKVANRRYISLDVLFCIRKGLSEKFKNHFMIQKKSEKNSINNFKKILKFNI